MTTTIDHDQTEVRAAWLYFMEGLTQAEIARRLGIPRRVMVVLEGEGLANDATALILYRFAVIAITTGSFSLTKATGTFFAIIARCSTAASTAFWMPR